MMRGVERGNSRDRLLNVMRHRRGCFSRHRVRPDTARPNLRVAPGPPDRIRLPTRSRHYRALRRAFKLRGKLGAEGGIGDYVPKPKWMRKQLARLADEADMTMRAFMLDALKAKGLEARMISWICVRVRPGRAVAMNRANR
jgi:hypothetical protein